MKKLLIYTLCDARKPNDIRYLGKTIRSLKVRLYSHLSEAKKCKKDNYYMNHKNNWINKVLSEGSHIIITELDSLEVSDNPTNEEWAWLESYWISQLKCWGFNLTNLTNGGDGNQGQPQSKETIEKRASKIRGTHKSDECKQLISEALKGKPKTEKHKQHVKQTMTEKFGIPVVQLDKKTKKFINEYPSITIAAETLDKSKANIAKCCQHKPSFNTAYGYIWMYKNEYIVLTSEKSEGVNG